MVSIRPLLDHDAEDVRDMLVEGTRLRLVLQLTVELCHSVGHLVSDDVEGSGEVVQKCAVAVTIYLEGVNEPRQE